MAGAVPGLAQANQNGARARELETTLFARFPNSVSVWRRTKARDEERDKSVK